MKAKYKIIKQEIKAKITEGIFLPHQKISSESEMMKEFGVSRHTVRLAIGELVIEGWLYRKQGAGTFCADPVNTAEHAVPAQRSIAIISTYISEYIFPTLIRGMEAYLSKQGYVVNIFNTNNNPEQERRILETIITGNYDGVVIEPTKSAFPTSNLHYYLSLERLNIPYIMINAHYAELDALTMRMDDVTGGFLQAEHLIQQGHKEIVGIYKTDDMQGLKRLKGYIRAHRAYGMPVNPTNLLTYSTKDAADKPPEDLERLLKMNNMPTAITFYNDQLALRMLNVIRARGLKVPDDISIVGYDDSSLAEASEVKLTSVKHPKSGMGEAAAQTISELIKQKNNKQKQDRKAIVYHPELIIRNSTKSIGEPMTAPSQNV